MIDIAVNLTSSQFDSDRDAVLARALQSGVRHCLLLASDIDEAHKVATMAQLWPSLCVATAGVHPHQAKNYTSDDLQPLRSLLVLPQVIAVGECGLDFNRDFSPRPQQELIFEAQLALAAELQMPLVLHERDASERFLAILKPWRDRLPGAVLHCFTGSREALYRSLDLDLHIGITGWICDERRGATLQSLISDIPASRLLLETDAPYLLPRDLSPKPSGRRNEPMYLPHIYRRVAELRGDELTTLIAVLQSNFYQLFGSWPTQPTSL